MQTDGAVALVILASIDQIKTADPEGDDEGQNPGWGIAGLKERAAYRRPGPGGGQPIGEAKHEMREPGKTFDKCVF